MISDLFIKNLQLQNYKSIRNLDVRFNKGLNIIIGENGAGKTNLLEYVYKCFSKDFNPFRSQRDNLTKDFSSYTIVLEYTEDEETYTSHFEKMKETRSDDEDFESFGLLYTTYKNGEKIKSNVDAFKELATTTKKRLTLIRKLRVHRRIFLISFNDPSYLNFISEPNGFVYEETEGSLLAHTPKYSYLLMEFESDFEDALAEYDFDKTVVEEIKAIAIKTFMKILKKLNLISYLKKFTPISDVKLNESINIFTQKKHTIIDNVQLVFKVKGNWIPWSYLSDGTKRIFYIILEAINPEKNFLLIEEPELGIHPHQLYKLMNFLKEMAEEKQIIITTHSPIALDVLSPGELDAIIIAKYTPKGTVLNQLTAQEIKKAKIYIEKTGNLSAYWLHSDLEK